MKILTNENNTLYLIFNESLKTSLTSNQLEIKAENLKKFEIFVAVILACESLDVSFKQVNISNSLSTFYELL